MHSNNLDDSCNNKKNCGLERIDAATTAQQYVRSPNVEKAYSHLLSPVSAPCLLCPSGGCSANGASLEGFRSQNIFGWFSVGAWVGLHSPSAMRSILHFIEGERLGRHPSTRCNLDSFVFASPRRSLILRVYMLQRCRGPRLSHSRMKQNRIQRHSNVEGAKILAIAVDSRRKRNKNNLDNSGIS